MKSESQVGLEGSEITNPHVMVKNKKIDTFHKVKNIKALTYTITSQY